MEFHALLYDHLVANNTVTWLDIKCQNTLFPLSTERLLRAEECKMGVALDLEYNQLSQKL